MTRTLPDPRTTTAPAPAPSARRRSRLARLAAGLLALGCALGVGAFERPTDGVHAQRIDWGVMMDLSGPVSAAQGPWVHGFQSYMRKVNEAGGIHGRRINVLAEDNRFDSSLDRIAYERLANQTPVLGISGVGNASAQVALMSSIRRGKVPVVGTYTTTRAGVEPASPMFYGGFCGYKEMAQVGVGFLTELRKLKAPRVATVHLDTAGGKEYADYVAEAAAHHGGSARPIPIKVGAADASAQVLEIIAQKPDFITVHGGPTTAILLMKTLQQYGLAIPTFAIAYLGTPLVYAGMGAEAGANYHFVSCFTPGGSDEPGVKDMSAYADKYGHAALKEDINFVAGWAMGQVVSEAIAKVGPEPTREKLVASMERGFEVDTKGLSAPIRYTKDNHLGLVVLRPYSYDYRAKRFKAHGEYADYQRFVR